MRPNWPGRFFRRGADAVVDGRGMVEQDGVDAAAREIVVEHRLRVVADDLDAARRRQQALGERALERAGLAALEIGERADVVGVLADRQRLVGQVIRIGELHLGLAVVGDLEAVDDDVVVAALEARGPGCPIGSARTAPSCRARRRAGPRRRPRSRWSWTGPSGPGKRRARRRPSRRPSAGSPELPRRPPKRRAARASAGGAREGVGAASCHEPAHVLRGARVLGAEDLRRTARSRRRGPLP